jgi:hypothetical protein
METAIGVVVRIATVFVLLFSAAVIARLIKRKIPEGRVKALLYKRLTP